MNALVKKEIRLLLPNSILAVVLALTSVFFHDRAGEWISGFQAGSWVSGFGYSLGCIFCPAIVVMLALNSFGVEVGTQTFSMMLAQPVTRLRIWQTKITLLALAMVAVGLVWYLSVVVPALHYQRGITPEDLADMLASYVLFGMVVFSGALWTVLLLRQVAGAFWFTLIVPGALLAIVAACCSGYSDEFILGMIATVLGLYSLAGFFFARWLFFRAQDLQWSGGTIVMPELRGLARFKAAVGTLRMWRPRVALWKKEIQLHQSQFVVAFALAVLHLGVLAVRKFCDLQNSRDLKAVLEGFWVLWMVMPLLVGCAAVAEERKLGTHEGQLCLPAKRRTQFIVKLLVVIGLSIFMGVLMPLLLEGSRILPDVHLEWWSPLILPGIAALTGAISFYISTMARNTLQTLAPAVLGILLVWPMIFGAAGRWDETYHFLWGGPLGYFIILPVMAMTVLALAFSNFGCVLTGWKMVAHNLLVLVMTLFLGVVVTSAVYHRFWEKLTRFEPDHGPARLSLSNPAMLEMDGTILSVRLPDGRIWAGRPVSPNSMIKMAPIAGKYVAGTNWLALEYSYSLTAGIKSDGTLWVAKSPPLSVVPTNRFNGIIEDRLKDLAQFGSETNWRSVLPMGRAVLLVKNDGTLWRLGNINDRSRQWPGLLAFSPERLGAESNWAQVVRHDYQVCFYKTDGTTWVSGDWSTNDQPCVEIEPGLVVHAVPLLNRNQIRSMITISHGLTFGVGVRNDGTFRIWAHQRLDPVHRNTYEWSLTDQQIGTSTNWVAVAGNWDNAVTLKNDGTLWLWDFQLHPFSGWDPVHFDREVARTVPVRLGTHSDWIAITRNDEGVTALAADGSLWFWPVMDAYQLADVMGLHDWHPLLDISHKPQLLGNIFSTAN